MAFPFRRELGRAVENHLTDTIDNQSAVQGGAITRDLERLPDLGDPAPGSQRETLSSKDGTPPRRGRLEDADRLLRNEQETVL